MSFRILGQQLVSELFALNEFPAYLVREIARTDRDIITWVEEPFGNNQISGGTVLRVTADPGLALSANHMRSRHEIHEEGISWLRRDRDDEPRPDRAAS